MSQKMQNISLSNFYILTVISCNLGKYNETKMYFGESPQSITNKLQLKNIEELKD